jgi:asparagine synthase (glutamine-hydrolysing)
VCGIAGLLELAGSPADPRTLEQMARTIKHRGPDDSGIYVDDAVGLANVRLAVIDTSTAGHQPMSSADGRYVISYNGELYNFRELASELVERGRSFESRTDTEVVLRAYEAWGPACLDRFNGMFAFAIWDSRERELFIARDRLGIKPVYYTRTGGKFAFSSEVKALIAAGYRPDVSPVGLAEYFTFQNILSDATLFEGVRMLPAGHFLQIRERETAPRLTRYWDLEFRPDESVSVEEWTAAVRDAFETAVARQLVSDVPIGSYLSGGLDSSSIALVASRSIPRLMTFTGGFDMESVTGFEVVFDERRDAEAIARLGPTEHYTMVMHAGDMAWVLPELVWHLEDLRVGMAYQNHYIARLASKFVTVTLAGTGGDELFAGYPWRYRLLQDARDSVEFERRHYEYWTRLVADSDKKDFFSPETWETLPPAAPLEAYRNAIAPAAHLDPATRAVYFEAKTFLHGLLVVEDRVSMANSLEARVPFLDNELVELALRIPVHLQYDDTSGKRILRRAMNGLLPEEVLVRPKQGFSPPDQSWYRGPTMDYIKSVLLAPRTVDRGYFRAARIERMLAEHSAGHANHRLLIWSLLCFEWWNRLFIDGERPESHRAWHSTTRLRRPS